MAKRNGHGGRRPNSGRKSKAEEQALVERLSPMEDLAHSKLEAALKKGEKWAVELYFSYMYGKPRQSMDVTSGGRSFTPYQDWTDEQIEDELNRLEEEE